MVRSRPFASRDALFEAADRVWQALAEPDWLEAFSHHPKIGDVKALAEKFKSTSNWAKGEQGGTSGAAPAILEGLAAGNRAYEGKFGFIFIVCATGKSAEEMLELLNGRLPNDRATELAIAAGEQAKITRLRLEKL
jgi:2-oxo-4-hydroxy-4-carboxy-5-ureidoimidazoline decarboxylase